MLSCGRQAPPGKKVIVLGVDGMDPNFIERHWDALPNLNRLRQRGSFQRLATTSPPQSPVAWSTFITGTDPAVHGILDFVHRDPATMQPFSSMARTEEPRFVLPLGSYRLPLSQAKVRTLRHGRAFWEILAERGIPVTVMHMPTNYPPAPVGRAIAGMGVPDLRGTLGKFTLFTDDAEEISRAVPGGQIVKVQLPAGHATLTLDGPPNPLRKDNRIATVNLTIDVDPQENVARLETGGTLAILKQGEWSPWLHAEFPLIPGLAGARGMFRVYARQLHPRFALYVSAVQIDPANPDLPISFPAAFSREIAAEAGPFYTLGIAEDTSALRAGVFDLNEYLVQSRLVLEDEITLLRFSLRHYRDGLLFFYFSSIDQNSHILWGKHEEELVKTYRAVDAAVGEVMQREPDAALIVMSDHGFAAFDRAFHLNSWLREQGYLAVNQTGIDWPRTRAYAMGLNGLYVNLSGREKYGIVKPGAEAGQLMAEIERRLTAYRDNGRVPVTRLIAPSPASPDRIVGYAAGYRASWQTALGEAPAGEIVTANLDQWRGDHCIDPAEVPGVLVTDRAIGRENPGLKDVTASVLALFGVDHVFENQRQAQ